MSAQVKPVPDNLHSITPNLVCRDAAGAIEFYKSVFGATEIARVPGPGGKIMHAVLKIADSTIFLNDAMGKLFRLYRSPAPATPYISICMCQTWIRFSTPRSPAERVSICLCRTCSGETATAS